VVRRFPPWVRSSLRHTVFLCVGCTVEEAKKNAKKAEKKAKKIANKRKADEVFDSPEEAEAIVQRALEERAASARASRKKCASL
jgi:hypothetical protein